MADLLFKDFVPKLLKEEDNYSTLALTGDVIGPKYETFEILIERANTWLSGGGRYVVVSCELVEIEGSHCVPATTDTDNEDDEEEEENRTYIAFLTALRVWYNESKLDAGQQLGYINIMPTRLESTPRAFGPKFQTLSESMENFNQRWQDDQVTVPGRILRIQTCCCRFSPRHCSVDPGRTSWLASDNTQLQWCYFFRLFYVSDTHTVSHTPPCQLGFRDFAPPQPTRRGGLVELLTSADSWLASSHLSLLNLQILDHPLFYKCMVDMPGQEQRKLNNPHVVTSFRSSVCHTKVVRLFYAATPSAHSPSLPFVKLFHVPMVHWTATSSATPRLSAQTPLWAPSTFAPKYSKVLDTLNHWVRARGISEFSIETVIYNCNRLKSRLSGLDTYSESHGEHKSFQLHALVLYAWNVTLDVQKESKPIPRYFADGSNSCTVL